ADLSSTWSPAVARWRGDACASPGRGRPQGPAPPDPTTLAPTDMMSFFKLMPIWRPQGSPYFTRWFPDLIALPHFIDHLAKLAAFCYIITIKIDIGSYIYELTYGVILADVI